MLKPIITYKKLEETIFLSPRQVADCLNVSVKSVRTWVRDGSLPALVLTSHLIKIPVESLLGFLEARGLSEIKLLIMGENND